MGYMPSYAVKRADTLTPARDGAMKFSMILSTEDDNIGIVPQFSGPSVKSMADLIKKNNMHGFVTRQFAHSKLLPAVHYLTHASWSRQMTMKQSYEHQFSPICGKRAMEPLLKAFGILERLTTDMHEKVDAVGFIHPTVITGYWKESGGLVSISDTGNIDRYEQIRKVYAKAAKLLTQAAKQSKPAGRPVVYALARHADFAVDWMSVRITMEQAQQLLAQAAEADKNEDVPGFADANDASEMKLREACELLNKATQAWADSVEDRCDLGVLAALNQYGLEALRSIHILAELRTIGWGKHQS